MGPEVHPAGRVHVIGAGPVGLLLTALLQSTEGCSVHLYEIKHNKDLFECLGDPLAVLEKLHIY